MPIMYLPLVIGFTAIAPLLFVAYRIEKKAKKALEPVDLARLDAQNNKIRILSGAFGASIPLANMFMPTISSWMVILPFSLIFTAGNHYLLSKAQPPCDYMRAQRTGSALLLVSMSILSVSVFFEHRAFEAKYPSRKNTDCPVESASPNPHSTGWLEATVNMLGLEISKP
jgi:hypothetical protein